MTKPPRLNQTFDYYTVSKGIQGDISWSICNYNIPCRANEGTLIVKGVRGEDIQYDLTLHTSYDTPLEKGNGLKFNCDYYLIDDVRVTRDLNGNAFMQFVLAKKTENISL